MCWMLGIQIKKKKNRWAPALKVCFFQCRERQGNRRWCNRAIPQSYNPGPQRGPAGSDCKTGPWKLQHAAWPFLSPARALRLLWNRSSAKEAQAQSPRPSFFPLTARKAKKKKKSNGHDMKRGLQWPTHLSSALLLMRPTRAEEAAVAGLQDGWLQALTLQERDK